MGPAIVLVILPYFAFLVLSYIFIALSLFTIAKRRGINNPWLAWIPVASNWILGSISDDYRKKIENKENNKRTLLLILSGGAVLLAILFMVVSVSVIFAGIDPFDGGYIAIVILLYLGMLGCFVVRQVFYFIALYDVYASCNPDTRIVFLILSIALGVVTPFFLMADRELDEGFKPRPPKPAPVQQYIPPQPVQTYTPPVQQYAQPVQQYTQPVPQPRYAPQFQSPAPQQYQSAPQPQYAPQPRYMEQPQPQAQYMEQPQYAPEPRYNIGGAPDQNQNVPPAQQ